MMRLPRFDYRAPRELDEAARILAGEGRDCMLLAGGTDLLPNMKRRQQTPTTLVALRGIEALRRIEDGDGLRLGAAVTLAHLAADARIRNRLTGLWQAAAQVASPQLRNMATLGGNLCLDTRCNYYNQNHEWRKGINFCLKKDGDTCWVATRSKRCVALSSTDTAPALIALNARVRLHSTAGIRELAVADLYNNDGIDYLARRGDEILSEVVLPDARDWRSTYWKLRRRGSFDFPLLGVAAAVRTDAGGTVTEARIALGAAASQPFLAEQGSEFLVGKRLDDEVIEAAARLIASRAKPMDNADGDIYWRKKLAPAYVGYALRELRGDDMTATRRRTGKIAFD